jgi:hypothetical protein
LRYLAFAALLVLRCRVRDYGRQPAGNSGIRTVNNPGAVPGCTIISYRRRLPLRPLRRWPVGEAPSSAIPVAGLRIEFDDRSWIEIRDATQKVVLVGEYAAGTRHNVDGKAPFQLWIGRASGVRVYMGERAIDLKPHTREEVARFTLD